MKFSFRKNLINSILLFVAICLGVISNASAASDKLYKPFVMAKTPAGDMKAVTALTKSTLTKAGFQIVGSHSPYKGAHIFSVTNNDILNIVKNEKAGAFCAVQRVTVADAKGKVQVSFTNPEYMAYSCRFNNNLKSVRSQLVTALGYEKDFGAEGLTEKKLRKYNYAWGMEEFDEPDLLAEYGSYKQAVAAVEKGLKTNKVGSYKVYRVDIPGKNMTVFGVGLKSPKMINKFQDDGYIMSVIDFEKDKHLGHLPHEIVVNGDVVEALNARFRIAINFPDLSMAGENSFMNIMGAPGGIQQALTAVAGGAAEEF